ncbi:MAG: polyprenyl synthetase family protein [candidate division KSB1 bacterium]|nr:polyprenyl synthetase family protein [candidate division KSB1 bacterium]MDZ7272593.1 polyprenyl synthetase family protein [candidate division KSB1 bacterium]MDZ7284384.1 polyprenyl synthetase family protein [candidate division KSB1 bacterium]MDZ7297220.1 polyprenyl synthetase family protein [candidate division KSB1 bacterium]MDZ7308552.1 polyprenyl synthetase family protein [candidate division KSB1 bacterium]
MSHYLDKFVRFKELVNTYLESFLAPERNGGGHSEPVSLYDPMRYAMAGNGKRIRPVLLLMTCDALGGAVEQALPAAAAVELMHNFTLVHDDIMDRDETRRGRPTVHRKWNVDVAILAGDGLVVLAYKSLLQTRTPQLNRICEIFTDGILEICEGQALDAEFEQDDSVTMARYEAMILKKTARLLALCTQIGAMLAGASAEQIAAFRRFAEHLGLAFQIQDDLLDITVEQATLGKDFGSDVRRHKRTFLYVHVMEKGGAAQRRALRDLFARPVISEEDILAAQHLFRSTGALAAASAAVQHHVAAANRNLAALAPAADLRALQQLVQMILHRKA